ncbi:MAG: hypothetical protein M3R24_23460 [Chloroflexota bacterium]|nr:hypothetical protein [Chloroflexota bacterium]PLS77327.1 MAG: hypothetical protein CYG59_24480 [Chloroflexota bacterium]
MINHRHDYGHDDDEPRLDTAAVLRELGWVCTLGALPLLVAALPPSVHGVLLTELPSYSAEAHHRLFVVGLVILLLGIVQYAGSMILLLRGRRSQS